MAIMGLSSRGANIENSIPQPDSVLCEGSVVERGIKGVMGRLETATDPAPAHALHSPA